VFHLRIAKSARESNAEDATFGRPKLLLRGLTQGVDLVEQTQGDSFRVVEGGVEEKHPARLDLRGMGLCGVVFGILSGVGAEEDHFAEVFDESADLFGRQ